MLSDWLRRAFRLPQVRRVELYRSVWFRTQGFTVTPTERVTRPNCAQVHVRARDAGTLYHVTCYLPQFQPGHGVFYERLLLERYVYTLLDGEIALATIEETTHA